MTLNLSGGFDVTQGSGTVSNPWIISKLTILSNETKAAGTYDIDVSNYLPDAVNDYEVLWVFSAAGEGNAQLKSDGVAFGGIFNGAETNSRGRVSGTLPITANRNVTYQVYKPVNGAYFSFEAYRKTTNF